MKKIIKKRRGVTTIEYGILAALIAIVTIIAIKKIGNNNDKIYCTISSSIQKAQYAKGEYYYSNNHCDNSTFMQELNLSPGYTLTDAYNACAQTNGGANTNIQGAGNINSCVVHAEQVRYAGDGDAYLKTAGLTAIPGGLSSEDYNKANDELTNETINYCNNQYPDSGTLSFQCQISLQNAGQSQNYNSLHWSPGNIS